MKRWHRLVAPALLAAHEQRSAGIAFFWQRLWQKRCYRLGIQINKKMAEVSIQPRLPLSSLSLASSSLTKINIHFPLLSSSTNTIHFPHISFLFLSYLLLPLPLSYHELDGVTIHLLPSSLPRAPSRSLTTTGATATTGTPSRHIHLLIQLLEFLLYIKLYMCIWVCKINLVITMNIKSTGFENYSHI